MINILSTLDVIVAILLIAIILMQRSEGGVLGMGGGGKMGGVLTTSSAGNLLTKLTIWLGMAFFVITILLAILVSNKHKAEKSALQSYSETKEVSIEEKADTSISEEMMIEENKNVAPIAE